MHYSSSPWYKRYRHHRRVGLNMMDAYVSKLRYGFPAHRLRVIGITGTDGKTTTANLLAAILRADGRKVGLISTLGANIDGVLLDTGLHVSTPAPRHVYRLLAQMRQQGVTDVVLEVTSHGLDQRRTAGISFDVGIVTNITPEHLDYHGTFANYVTAKARLVRQAQVAILNSEDPSTPQLTRVAKRVLRYGWHAKNLSVWADNVAETDTGSTFALHARPNQFGLVAAIDQTIELHLPGRYNILNSAAAATAALVLGVSDRAIRSGLGEVRALSGRWEVLQAKPFMVIVDFAHTPHAFEEALPEARKHVKDKGRLIHVFGCPALRDMQKREPMGRLSGTIADITILTIEDPRTEPIDQIMSAIELGLRHAHKQEGPGWKRIDDRGEAIAWAIGQARSGDVVMVTGKGHEQSLAIGQIEHPWTDQEAVRDVLAGRTPKRLLPRDV
jgi:UDP-N-acetylmuramoyl-L-alanyl-D-glutamate--2,6-diaminopimelate ligase